MDLWSPRRHHLEHDHDESTHDECNRNAIASVHSETYQIHKLLHGAFLYVTVSGRTDIQLIDTNPANSTFNTIVDSVSAGTSPLIGGQFVPGGALFLAGNQVGQFLAIDSDPMSATYHTVVGTTSLAGIGADDRVDITRDARFFYFTNKALNTVRVIDLNLAVFNVVATITVGTSPTHLAITPF